MVGGDIPGPRLPLPRLLFDRDERGVVAAQGSAPPSDEDAITRFDQLARASNGNISVERMGGIDRADWHRRTFPHAAVGDRDLRPDTRRTLAPHLLQRNHVRIPRSPCGQRA